MSVLRVVAVAQAQFSCISSTAYSSRGDLALAMAIDTSGSDRGLEAIFLHVDMDGDLAPLRRMLMDPAGVTRWKTTEDFTHYVSKEAPEAHIGSILSNFPGFEEPGAREPKNHMRDRAIGKLRQALNMAQRISIALEELPPDADEDLELPLSAALTKDLQTKWFTRYHLKPRPEYTPCAENVAAYYRMCKNVQAFKFFKLDKHKALDGEKLKVGADMLGIQLHYDQMRIMANAVSKGGNFAMTCSVLGPGTIMAPLDVNLNYADDALHKAMKMRSPQWLLERDKITRVLMVKKIQTEGMSQGEALRQAWAESTFEWKDATLNKDFGKKIPSRRRSRTPLRRRGKRARSSGSSDSSSSSRSGPATPMKAMKRFKGKKGTPWKAMTKKNKQADRARAGQKTVRFGKNRLELCPAANTAKGCKKKNCKLAHNVCNRRLTTGGACGGNHKGYKCDNPDRVK